MTPTPSRRQGREKPSSPEVLGRGAPSPFTRLQTRENPYSHSWTVLNSPKSRLRNILRQVKRNQVAAARAHRVCQQLGLRRADLTREPNNTDNNGQTSSAEDTASLVATTIEC